MSININEYTKLLWAKLNINALFIVILICTLFSIKPLSASDIQWAKTSQTPTEISTKLEHKLVHYSLKNDLPVPKIIRIIERYIQTNQLSERKNEVLNMTMKKLQEYWVDYILPDHWDLSSKENILTYRLHHYYRENYLKNKAKNILSSYIFKKDVSEKIVYLTFDDGPYDKQKPLVDYMIEREIPGTFFLLCSKINKYNIWAYRKDYFSVWIHTNTHENYDLLTKDEILNDVDACNQKFDEHNLEKRIFRPAFGIVNLNESKVLALNNIDWVVWSMDSLDWEWVFNEQRINEMLESVSPWEIILFHENVDMEMFIKFITELEKKGYSFWKL